MNETFFGLFCLGTNFTRVYTKHWLFEFLSNSGNSTDWSLMDPAIVSFRPYQSFMSGPLQQSQSDMFISPPHMAQQQINGQFDTNKFKSNEFSNRNNLMQSSYGTPHGLNLQNGIMGQQQPANSQQVSN